MKKISLYFSLIWGGGINFLFFETNLEINFFSIYIFFLFGVFGIFLSLITRKECNFILSLLSLFLNSIPVVYTILYFLIIEVILV